MKIVIELTTLEEMEQFMEFAAARKTAKQSGGEAQSADWRKGEESGKAVDLFSDMKEWTSEAGVSRIRSGAGRRWRASRQRRRQSEC